MVLYLRHTEKEDMELLYRWANDPVTRQNGFHPKQIAWEEHRQWFEKVMRDEAVVLYICMEGESAVGQIRLQIEAGEALISYSVDAGNRGRGIGTLLLGLAEQKMKAEYPQVRILAGEVKFENTASMRAFVKNGYRGEEKADCMIYRKEI